jgi:hypothetical protein
MTINVRGSWSPRTSSNHLFKGKITMHISTKDVVADARQAKELSLEIGSHIITALIEGDGAVALASDKAEFDARVISVQRTDSGGIQVQTAVFVREPAPEKVKEPEAPKPQPTAEEQAISYLVSKGSSEDEAKSQVERFGVDRILSARNKELDAEVAALVSK